MGFPSVLHQFAWGLVLPSIYISALNSQIVSAQSLDEINNGYTISPAISQQWGTESPYFAQKSTISADVPDGCTITFAQVLSRHGARDPSAKKTAEYNVTVAKIQSSVDLKNLPSDFAFLKDFKYTLGADQLTTFGGQELINSGIKFANRYKSLAAGNTMFVRSSGELRVVQSAANFTVGYEAAKANATVTALTPSKATTSALPILVVSEDEGTNNTLNHGLCAAFEDGPASKVNDAAQLIFQDTFIPAIQDRMNKNLVGANLTADDTINMMDLCSFETVALTNADPLSPFCNLFTQSEWESYGYYQSIGKWYGFGLGNPLGPTQGVGWTNELIARLTNKPVQDNTSTNHTITGSNSTFPIGLKLYADFSHDNDINTIMFAMGLFNSTDQLSNTTLQTLEQTNGYSASTTVPYSARMYVEKMTCSAKDSSNDELVRIIINDRVLPLLNCGADKLGRCTVQKFTDSLTFAKQGGHWDQCAFTDTKANKTVMAPMATKQKNATASSTPAKKGNSTSGVLSNAGSATSAWGSVAGYTMALTFGVFLYL